MNKHNEKLPRTLPLTRLGRDLVAICMTLRGSDVTALPRVDSGLPVTHLMLDDPSDRLNDP